MVSISSDDFDTLATLSFRVAVLLLLIIIVWLQVAPVAGTDPDWWEPFIGRGTAIAMLAAFASLLFTTAAPIWREFVEADRTEGT